MSRMPTPKLDIVVCGSATLDVLADTDSELITISGAGHDEKLVAYPAGCKMLIDKLQFAIGGGGTNTACAFARMGLSTGYAGSLGDDDNSRRVTELLDSHGIVFLGHTTSGAQTGYSIILDSKAHDRTILTHKGANDILSYKKLTPGWRSASWLYFSSMMGQSLTTQEQMVASAAKVGVKVAYNPSEYQVKKGYQSIRRIIEHTHVLIFNRQEAELLTGKEDIKEIMGWLLAKGVEIVIVTDGSKQVYACDGSTLFTLTPTKTRVVESTGAGDAFASATVAGLIKGLSLEEALRLGQANAESVIGHAGAKSGLLTYTKARRNAKASKVGVCSKGWS